MEWVYTTSLSLRKIFAFWSDFELTTIDRLFLRIHFTSVCWIILREKALICRFFQHFCDVKLVYSDFWWQFSKISHLDSKFLCHSVQQYVNQHIYGAYFLVDVNFCAYLFLLLYVICVYTSCVFFHLFICNQEKVADNFYFMLITFKVHSVAVVS